MKNNVLSQMTGTRVLVLPGAFYSSIVNMFAKAGCRRAETIEDADFVVFTGGEDIEPRLYGEKTLPQTYFTRERDVSEMEIYCKCLELEKPMVGICRGAQILHALNGGKLWQHVQGHGQEHDITDVSTGEVLKSSSLHHQMLRNNDKLELVAVASNQVSTLFKCEEMEINLLAKRGSEIEIEACCYPETKCWMTQGHPEIGPDEYTDWFIDKVQSFLYAEAQPDKKVVNK